MNLRNTSYVISTSEDYVLVSCENSMVVHSVIMKGIHVNKFIEDALPFCHNSFEIAGQFQTGKDLFRKSFAKVNKIY